MPSAKGRERRGVPSSGEKPRKNVLPGVSAPAVGKRGSPEGVETLLRLELHFLFVPNGRRGWSGPCWCTVEAARGGGTGAQLPTEGKHSCPCGHRVSALWKPLGDEGRNTTQAPPFSPGTPL